MTIIKMKKHPIDDLFAKKLAEHRQEPSQKALEKFQQRLAQREEKPKGGLFVINRRWGYFAAAASIFAVLTVGILSQQDENPTLAAHSSKNQTKTHSIEKPISDNQIAQKKIEATNQTESQAEKKVEISIKDFSVENAIAKIEKSILKEEKEIRDEPIHDELTQAVTATNETPSTNIFSETPVNEVVTNVQPKQESSFKQDVGDSIVLILDTVEEQTQIPSISEDSAINLAEAQKLGEEKAEEEKSFLAKLYTEYKHFKYGEKVDLASLGINKKEVLARVDERFFKEEREDMKEFVQRRFRTKRIQD